MPLNDGGVAAVAQETAQAPSRARRRKVNMERRGRAPGAARGGARLKMSRPAPGNQSGVR